ncbi:hypothetical protein I2492_15605 [Budviciaceae bacterium CWB-B4]|uniref:Putative tail fiber protein gp53-like C-terminal domain-containing protein n=1 Tax=Limnobaculum xujianqingii TaxID=2738837 RepID=A0A9D7AKY5_9GAMM|nr:hypothetical protein [Limnobaculum xujianqingii]MBK5074587.1 hypothetical protein [Limnobaculum xujianqingii]MBK5177747.1 hypothetical protein [Limnobaculum xujianqingii]
MDALDDGDLDGLITKFTDALITNLNLGTAATKNIGIGSGQIPDMSYFENQLGAGSALGGSGFQRLPGGYIRQFGSAAANSSGDVTITFPFAFASKPDAVYFGYKQASAPNAIQSVIINDALFTNVSMACRAYKIDGTGVITGSTNTFFWVAEGKI